MNLVILLGNLGKDPTIKYSQDGMAFCSYSIATSDRIKDKQEPGLYREVVEWHNILTFGKTAELCNKYLAKGRQVLVEGSVHYRNFDGKDGKKVYVTEIKAHRVKFIGGRNEVEVRETGGGQSVDTPTAPDTGQVEQVSFEDFSDIPF